MFGCCRIMIAIYGWFRVNGFPACYAPGKKCDVAYVFFCGGNLNSDKIEHLILYLDC